MAANIPSHGSQDKPGSGRVLVCGAGGLLGKAVVRAFSAAWDVCARTHAELDVSDLNAIIKEIEENKPALVINCAGYTRVDHCEKFEPLAMLANAEGAANLASTCAAAGTRLFHISTDYVFDGTKTTAYTEEDVPGPAARLCAYGRSKLEGEERVLQVHPAALVIRTSWLFGEDGPCFPKAIFKQIADGNPLRVVNDQTGRPTYTADLAAALVNLAAMPARGLLHVANSDDCTWYEFAVEIVRGAGLDAKIQPISSAELTRHARRPAWSVLDTFRYEMLMGRPMRTWREALAAFLRKTC